MFRGAEIKSVVEVLNRREAHLFHACQYRDLLSYLDIGGIPSRQLLEETGASFTSFETDAVDHQNAVWDKVFLNLSDFGATFARGKGAVPNPYGPVLLRVAPEALLDATDVAICLRSAGAQGFSRERESLRSADEVDRLFARSADEGYPASTFIKFAPALKVEFNSEHARDPEISLSVPAGFIDLTYVDRAIVDPYTVAGVSLAAAVRQAVRADGWKFPVYERRSDVGGARYDALAHLVAHRTPPLRSAAEWDTSDDLREWARDIAGKNLEYQFGRYAEYFRQGTLEPLAGRPA